MTEYRDRMKRAFRSACAVYCCCAAAFFVLGGLTLAGVIQPGRMGIAEGAAEIAAGLLLLFVAYKFWRAAKRQSLNGPGGDH